MPFLDGAEGPISILLLCCVTSLWSPVCCVLDFTRSHSPCWHYYKSIPYCIPCHQRRLHCSVSSRGKAAQPQISLSCRAISSTVNYSGDMLACSQWIYSQYRNATAVFSLRNILMSIFTDIQLIERLLSLMAEVPIAQTITLTNTNCSSNLYI